MIQESKVIIILKRNDNISLFLELIRKKKPRAVFLCPVEYGCKELIKRIEGLCASEGKTPCQQLDFVSEFNRNAFRYKNDYIAFVGGLSSKKITPKQDLVSYLKCPFRDFSIWWFSLISERSTFKTSSYSLFIRILTIISFKHKFDVDKIWASSDSAMQILADSYSRSIVFVDKHSRSKRIFINLKAFIIEALKAIKFYTVFTGMALDIKIFHLRGKRSKDLFENDLFLITPFPYLDMDALNSGKFINRTYGALPESIQLNSQKAFSWLGMFVNVEPYSWADALRISHKVRKLNVQFELLEEYLNFSILLRLAFFHLIIFGKFLNSFTKFSKLFSYQNKEYDISLDLWPIFRNDLISSIAGKTLLDGLRYYFLFSAVISNMKKSSKILHFCEMQAWEKALQIAAREKSKHKCIGLQHTILAPMLLSYFNHACEMSPNLPISKKPLPDKLGCVGRIVRDLFIGDGWNKDKVFVAGAFRFHELGIRSKAQDMHRSRTNTIVVAFGMSAAVNREILYFVYEAFNNKKCPFKVLLKPHPCQAIDKDIGKLELELDPSIFEVTLQPLYETVPKSKAMIVKGSSSIFEALINGIPAIIPQLYETIDLCPLSGVSDLPIYANSPDELYKVVLNIINDVYGYKDLHNGKAFVGEYLTTFQSKSRYYGTILDALR